MSRLRSFSMTASARPKTTNLAPLGHLPPVCNDFAWISKLLRRDVKAVYESTKARVTIKVQRFFSGPAHSSDKKDECLNTVSNQTETSIAKTTVVDEAKEDTPFMQTPQHKQKISISTVVSTQSSPFTIDPDTRPTTRTISVAQEPQDKQTEVPEVQVVEHDTLYSYLRYQLDTWRTNVPRDLMAPDRWKFRGILILLYMIVELSASNPAYNMLRGGREAKEQHSFVLGLTQLIASHGAEGILTALRRCNGQVSKMPALPYANKGTLSEIRLDSAHTSVSEPTGYHHSDSPHTMYLWAAVMMALLDRDYTEDIISEIMGLACSDVIDVEEWLVHVGNPNNRWWASGEDDKTRSKLRKLLSPEIEMLLA